MQLSGLESLSRESCPVLPPTLTRGRSGRTRLGAQSLSGVGLRGDSLGPGTEGPSSPGHDPADLGQPA